MSDLTKSAVPRNQREDLGSADNVITWGQIARFQAKVDTSAGLFECWPWRLRLNSNGYAQFWLQGRYRPAAQVALEIALGRPLGPEMQACHNCDNPPCMNPAHLFEGTVLDNARDKVAKGRAFHPIGERHPMAKLTSAQVELIRVLATQGHLQREIAGDFGIDQSTVSLIVRRIRWAA